MMKISHEKKFTQKIGNWVFKSKAFQLMNET